VASYRVHGVRFGVRSDVADVLRRVDDTYAAFRAVGDPGTELTVLARGGSASVVTGGPGDRREWPDARSALCDVLGRIVKILLAGFDARGLGALHAGAVVRAGRATVVAGTSGQGKTTLVLGLVARGLGLLSDELALIEPSTSRILPYRRSVHVRPGTPELVPELTFLHDRPRHAIGGGVEWALPPADVARVLPGGLADPAPLSHVILLDGRPDPRRPPSLTPVTAGVAAMELLRSMPSAATDFGGALRRLSRLLPGASCARLRGGPLEPTLDLVLEWTRAAA
jgi:hypothetical protein